MSKYFFIGVAGSGMSAIAQYLSWKGHKVSGSDRIFVKNPNHPIRNKLEKAGIKTFAQGEAIIDKDTDAVIVSTAIEETVFEYRRAKELKIPVLHRSDILADIAKTTMSVAVAGTSGKSTTTAMITTILNEAGKDVSMINGAGLAELMQQGLIGNAVAGKSDILVFEADESDGTLVKYHPQTGLILNIERDHKELNELKDIFQKFAQNSKKLIINKYDKNLKEFHKFSNYFFCEGSKFYPKKIEQSTAGMSFEINGVEFFMPVIGLHNAMNAAAAVAVADIFGISISECAEYLRNYTGIDRRMQIIGQKNGVLVIDDYAHNPAKVQSALKSAKSLGNRVFALFQPHGFGPLAFMKNDFINYIGKTLDQNDELYVPPVYYAGGTVIKKYTSIDFVDDLKQAGVNAFYLQDKNDFPKIIHSKLSAGDVIIVMGGRDPLIGEFSKSVFEKI